MVKCSSTNALIPTKIESIPSWPCALKTPIEFILQCHYSLFILSH
jgi:hypothetical protein